MRNKLSYLVLMSALAVIDPTFAISNQGQTALNAFRRYEPEFSNALRGLQEIDKKIADNSEDEAGLSKNSELWLKAEEMMAKIEERYDSMEDLYNITLSRNPGDQIELQEGFNRLDDVYRQVRDFYEEKYTYRGNEKKEEPENTADSVEDVPIVSVSSEDEFPYYVEPLKAEDYKLTLASDQDREPGRFKVTGKLVFETRNANENHQSLNNSIPNDHTQGRLLLTYRIDENREFSVEERYLTRERNEKIKENHLTLSYFSKHGDNSGLTLRDKLQHVWYPDNSDKNYRVNVFEGIYTKNYDNVHERTVSAFVKSKLYQHNSRSDYNQYTISDEESWNKRDTNIFANFQSDFVKYRNVGNLDYDNFNVYTSVDKSYHGNKANLKVSNTYDRRIYDIESVEAYRTSYYDEYLQIGYELPVNHKLTYSFEGEYTKHEFGSDEPRGYSEINLFNQFVTKVDSRTYVIGDYRHIYNDENTRTSAHKNNIFHVGWKRNVNKDYMILLNETYHDRNSVDNPAIDFKANKLSAEFDWRLRNNYRLNWNTEHYQRRYDNISLGVSDFRYLESGLTFSYAKRKAYDWKLSQKWRKMGYRNWGGVASGWNDRIQPVTEIKYNKWLKENLKFAVKASWEKTYYREYNNDSQDLEYNFNDLMYNKEIYASIEYIF